MGSSLSITHSSIDELSDDDLYALIQSTTKNDTICHVDSYLPAVRRLTSDTVVKYTDSPTEAFIMSYVSSHTSIPIPKVRRVLSDRLHPTSDSLWIIMDYIDGEVIETAWKQMSWWRRLCTVWSVRRYIRELHKTPLPNPDVPGPFDDSGRSYPCKGYYFTESGAGPFNSYVEMAAWFDRRRFDTIAAMHSECGGVLYQCPKFDTSHPLVLCHMDLHMRNMIVDRNGKLWIVDWGFAGAFPVWLEYAQMAIWESAAREEVRPPKSWTWFAPFMLGDYRRYKTGYLDRLRWAWDRPNSDCYPLDYFDEFGLTID